MAECRAKSKSMQPFVSIAIPAYKVHHLAESIRSALSQTYANIEVVVVNDHSPKDVERVVKSFTDSRLRYYVNEYNLGRGDPSRNWNQCLRQARGEWFCLLCDDDMYAPTFVETMLQLAEKYPQCDVLRSGVRVIDGEGSEVSRYPLSPEYETLEQYMWDLFQGLRRQTISEFMLRRSRMVAEGGYVNLPYAWGSDNLSIFRFSLRGGIASSQQPLVTFRDSGTNISSDHCHMDEKLQAFQNYIEQTRMGIQEHGLRSDLLPVIDIYYNHACADHMMEADNQALWHIPVATLIRVLLRKYGFRLK